MLRRALGAGLAALLAAGAGSTALALSAAPAAAATKPGYVAVVISGHGTHCVKWKSGITGDTVLNDVAMVAYRSDGLIVAIDSDPSSGTADASHYWSYWHDTKSTWAYSNYGASSYDPPAGSVEGWSYDNGKASAPPPSQKPSGLYTQLCGAKDKANGGGTVPVAVSSRASTPSRTSATAPKPTHSASPTTSTAQSTKPERTSSAASTAAGSTAAGATAASSATPSTSSSGVRSSGPAATTSPNGVPVVPPTPASSGSRQTGAPGTIDASPTSASASSSGSPVGLLVGIGLVVVLGAGAGAFALRRRGV